MLPNISTILANTAEYGFRFVSEMTHVGKGPNKREAGPGPIMVIDQPALFEKHFPGRIVAMLDGSSPRVISQSKIRNAWEQWKRAMPNERGPKPTDEMLQPMVLAAILGVRAKAAPMVVERRVYILPDQSTTMDEAEFRKAWKIPASK